eukprot:9642115-Alexandrium_andersonii.AAC.1
MCTAVARVKARGPCRVSPVREAAKSAPCTSAASSEEIASPPRVGVGFGLKERVFTAGTGKRTKYGSFSTRRA